MEVSDFSDLFIKNSNFSVDEEDNDNCGDLFSNNGTESVRFCKAFDEKSKEAIICKIFDPSVLQKDIEPGSDFKQDLRWYRQLMILREALILRELHHPTIVNFKGLDLYNNLIKFDPDDSEENISKPIIFLEFLTNKSIQSHIDRKGILDLPAVKRQICIIGITASIRFLHARNILHRSLNPNTIWLDENLYPKIFDFSTSRSFNSSKDTPKTILDDKTDKYKAPEIIDQKSYIYSDEIDIFSLGRLIYLMVTGYEPFQFKTDPLRNASNINLRGAIVDKNTLPVFPKKVSKEYQDLIKSCCEQNPNKRPKISEIYDLLTTNKSFIISEIKGKEELEEIQNYIKSIEQFEKEHPITNEFFHYKLEF